MSLGRPARRDGRVADSPDDSRSPVEPSAPVVVDVHVPDVGGDRLEGGAVAATLQRRLRRWSTRVGAVVLAAAAVPLVARSAGVPAGQSAAVDRAYAAAAANGNAELWQLPAADLVAFGHALCSALERGTDPYELISSTYPRALSTPPAAAGLTGAARRYALLLAASTYCPGHSARVRQEVGGQPACHALETNPGCADPAPARLVGVSRPTRPHLGATAPPSTLSSTQSIHVLGRRRPAAWRCPSSLRCPETRTTRTGRNG